MARLQTKLRHVDIHNHWLRQEVRNGRIAVKHVPTKNMIANGLTKALSKSEFHKFLQQVNLVNIASQIVEREIRENKQEELNHNSLLASVYGGYYVMLLDWYRCLRQELDRRFGNTTIFATSIPAS